MEAVLKLLDASILAHVNILLIIRQPNYPIPKITSRASQDVYATLKYLSYSYGTISSEINLFYFGKHSGMLNVLKEAKHSILQISSRSKQLKTFRKSLELTKFNRPLLSQAYPN